MLHVYTCIWWLEPSTFVDMNMLLADHDTQVHCHIRCNTIQLCKQYDNTMLDLITISKLCIGYVNTIE